MWILVLWAVLNILFFIQLRTRQHWLAELACIGVAVGSLMITTLLAVKGWLWLIPALCLVAMTSISLNLLHNEHTQRSRHDLGEQWLYIQLLLASLCLILLSVEMFDELALSAVAALALIMGMAAAYKVNQATAVSRNPMTNSSNNDLPTVSLLIPARNEGHSIEATLTSAIGSDYEKLEILVLDDCSQDSTPEIIRGYAHDGIRFIEGEPVPKGWLGRNYALHQLEKAANGRILIVCDVDIEISEQTISILIDELLTNKDTITSIHPSSRTQRWSQLLLQPLRAYWKILFQKSPIHGQFIAIDAEALVDVGGFAAFADKYFFENDLARSIQRRHSYHNGSEFGLFVSKSPSSQFNSQLRTLFLLVNGSYIANCLAVLGLILGLIMPLVLLFSRLWWLGGLVIGLWLYSYWLLGRYELPPRRIIVGVLFFPVRVCLEITLLLISGALYSLNKVTWKERQVCLPAFKSIPKLPKI